MKKKPGGKMGPPQFYQRDDKRPPIKGILNSGLEDGKKLGESFRF
jgi:hypothetical protein